jgi:hypothetical protein
MEVRPLLLLRLALCLVGCAACFALPASAQAATPFVAVMTGGEIQFPLFSIPVPAASGAFVGSLDEDAHTTVPVAGTTLPSLSFSQTVSGLPLTGSVQLISTEDIVGDLDPVTGAIGLSGAVRADLSLTSPFAGSCQIGTQQSPFSLDFSTSAPGVPYSPSSAAFTLSAPLSVPSPANCTGLLSLISAPLSLIFGGSGRLTLTGVLALPGFRDAGGGVCNAGAPQMSVGAPRVYGHGLSAEYVLFRTNFWRLAPTGWVLTSSPFLISTATAVLRTNTWFDLGGNEVGATESVFQTAATNPPGGVWLATQELYWLDAGFQLTGSDQLLASRITGPNARGGFCRWSAAAATLSQARAPRIEAPGRLPHTVRRQLQRLERGDRLPMRSPG